MIYLDGFRVRLPCFLRLSIFLSGNIFIMYSNTTITLLWIRFLANEYRRLAPLSWTIKYWQLPRAVAWLPSYLARSKHSLQHTPYCWKNKTNLHWPDNLGAAVIHTYKNAERSTALCFAESSTVTKVICRFSNRAKTRMALMLTSWN